MKQGKEGCPFRETGGALCVFACVCKHGRVPWISKGPVLIRSWLSWPLSSESQPKNALFAPIRWKTEWTGVTAEVKAQTQKCTLVKFKCLPDQQRKCQRADTTPTERHLTHVQHDGPKSPLSYSRGAPKGLLHNRNSAAGLGRQLSCCCETDNGGQQERTGGPPLFSINAEGILSDSHSHFPFGSTKRWKEPWHHLLNVKSGCHCL